MSEVTVIEWVLVYGWGVAAALGVALVRERRDSERRRMALNRALHELRRPLQALALGLNGPMVRDAAAFGRLGGQLELACASLADLDMVANGDATPARRRVVPVESLVDSVSARWRERAAAAGGGIDVVPAREAAPVFADPLRIEQALENLIANAIEHGGAQVRIGSSVVGDRVRISVRDAGTAAGERAARPKALRARRGHGLAVVATIAAAHGGRFAVRATASGTVAVLELPLARPGSIIAA